MEEARNSFRQRMVIEFAVGSPTSRWNLQMARLVVQLWEVCQLHNVNLKFDASAGDLSRKFIRLSDYRMSCKLNKD